MKNKLLLLAVNLLFFSGLASSNPFSVTPNGATGINNHLNMSLSIGNVANVAVFVPFTVSTHTTPASCETASDGTVVAYASGGVTPYGSYALVGPGTNLANSSGIFTGLMPGTYVVSATDGGGTTVTQGVVVGIANQLTVSPNVSICPGNSTTLTVSGSNAPYTWTAAPADGSLTTPNSPNPTVSPTVTTNYTVTSTPTTVVDLIFNGNFSNGNVGFLSDYAYTATSTGTKQYGVETSASAWNAGLSACTDHTSGAGNMLVVDGSTVNAGNDMVWSQIVPVTAGQNYTFSYWIQAVGATNPAAIETFINGVSMGAPDMAPATVACGNWTQVTYTWNSGASNTAQIILYDRTITAGGNDFALDDISFTTVLSCTISETVRVSMATASMFGNTTIGAGGSATISFVGSPFATVNFTSPLGPGSVVLDANGDGAYNIPYIAATTVFTLVSITTITTPSTPSCTRPLTGTVTITVNTNTCTLPLVEVSIDAPAPVCNLGDCIELLAHYSNRGEPTDYVVTPIPYCPSFPFTGGTVINATGDDTWSPIVPLPFEFNFYGQCFDEVLVGTNGVITFDLVNQAPLGYCNWPFTATIPNAAFPIKNAIYGVYQDTNIAAPPVTNVAVQNVNYYVLDTGPNAAPNRVFVANFNELPQFSCNAGVGFQTSQIVIHETTNIIEIFVNKRTSCTGWNSGSGLIGVQNFAGSLATVPPGRNTGTWTATNEAWRFLPKNIPTIPTEIRWLENGNPIPGSVGVNPLQICPTGPTDYTAVVTYTNCTVPAVVTETVSINVAPPLPTIDPVNINICSSAAAPYTVNINQTAAMLAGVANPGNYWIKYYENYTAAENDAPGNIPNAQLNTFTFSGPMPKTIYVRIEDLVTTGCYNIRPFTITIGSPTGTIAYPATPYCNNIPTPQSITENTLTPGGTYSAVSVPPGSNLTINPTTGAITPNTSDVGVYTVTYSIAANPPCPAYDTTTTVEIIACSCVATASSNAETLCIGDTLTPITYTTPGATSVTVTPALPPGLTGVFNAATETYTVSGTVGPQGVYSYTVALVSGLDTCTATTAITVNAAATIALSSGSATQSVCVDSGIANIVYTVTGGVTGVTPTDLPPGVNGVFDPLTNTYTISGIPNVANTYNYTLATVGGCGTANAAGTITVNPAVTIALDSAIGTDAQVVCINTPITTIEYLVGNGATNANSLDLPAGLTGSFASGVYTIVGSPSAAGTHSYTVTTSGGCSSATLTGTVTVNPDATIALTSGSNTQTVCVSENITPIVYTVADGATGVSFTVPLPVGFTSSFDTPSGEFTITGSSASAGTFNYTVVTTGGCSSATLSGTITVDPDVTLTLSTGSDTQNLCINTAIGTIVYATANGATDVTATDLPSGVTGTFDPVTGQYTISGTPDTAMVYNYTLTTVGGCGTDTATGTITVNPDATIALTAGDANPTVCIAESIVNIVFTVADGATGATIAPALPAGFTTAFNPVTSEFTISGSSAAALTYNYTVTTTGGCSSDSESGIITVNPDATIVLTSGSDNQVVCVDSGIATIVYTVGNGVTGVTPTDLPPGVTGIFDPLTNTYTITGIPNVANTYNYTLDTTGGCATANIGGTILVNPAATILQSSAIGTDAQTVCIGQNITNIVYVVGNGATGASLTPALPANFTTAFNPLTNEFTISGSGTAAGTFGYTVATVGGCSSSVLTGSIKVDPDVTITLDVAGTDAQTVCNNVAITPIVYNIANGGTGATIAPTPPAGITTAYDPVNNTFTISGSTLVVGTYNYTVTTTGGCAVASDSGSVLVNPDATIGQLSPAGTENQVVCINTAITPIDYQVGSGATGALATGLPIGLTGTFNPATNVYTISGTPTVAGTYIIGTDTVGGCGLATLSATITVDPNVTMVLDSAAGTNAQTVCNGAAIAPIVYEIDNGGTGATIAPVPPAGITTAYDPVNNTFTISGSTPTVGTYAYTVTTVGGCGSVALTGTVTTTPDVTMTLDVAGSDTQTVCINTPITTFTYTIANGATGVNATGLPPGVTGNFNATTGIYTLSGAPNTAGPYSFSLITVGGCGSDTAGGTITVNPNATISLASGLYNQSVCIGENIVNIIYTVADGATGATISPALPAGFTTAFNPVTDEFTISGASATSGVFAYTVTTIGGCSSASLSDTITVKPDVTMTLASGSATQTVCIDTPITTINYSIVNSGATGATIVGLPNGLTTSFDDVTDVFTITGSPNEDGVFNYTITTSGGCSSVVLTGTITVDPNVTLVLSTAGADDQTVCINTAIDPVTFTVGNLATGAIISSGGLPLGVTGSFNTATGAFTISGAPTSAGTFNYIVSTTGGCSVATLSGVIVVTPNVTLTLTSTSGTTNQTVCQGLAIAPISYTIGSGATGANVTGLPTGITASFDSLTGVVVISGSTSLIGTHGYDVTTTGGCSSATLSGVIEITPSASIQLASAVGTDEQQLCMVQESLVDIDYSVADGATGAFVVAGTVPVGISGSFNPTTSTFTLSGTPTESGSFTYTVRTTGGCGFSEIQGTILVYALPEVELPTDGYICVDENGMPKPGSTFQLTTGIPAASHTFEWSDANGVITGAVGNNYTATAPGVYSVAVTNNSTGCFNTATTTVISSFPPLSVKATASEYFSQEQVVTIVALPIGNYEYQVDNGAWQDSNNFFNLPSGEHHFTVRDKVGCGELSTSIIIIDYPKFFTPNNDGYNDTWNIVDLKLLGNQETSKIEIFDRYGKLLKAISPLGTGWDGTLNGKALPATDYWFKVNYTDELGLRKEFKAHFALKR